MNDDAARAGHRTPGAGAPGAGTRRVAGVVLVVAGLLLAAAALRPDGGLLGTAVTGPVRTLGPVVLLSLGWLVVVGRFASRLREEVRHLVGPTPWAERLREAAVVLLAGAAVAVPVLMVVLHTRAVDRPDPAVEPKARPTEPVLPDDQDTVGEPGAPVEPLLAVLAAALVLALLAVLVVVLLRMFRLHRLGRRQPPGLLPAAPPRAGDVLAAAVDTGRRALTGDDARAAVIACYAAMEGTLAVSGISRRDCDSPTELLERAVAHDGVDPVHTGALTALFREARYSTHPMDGSHVDRARAALDAVAARLEARADGPPGPDGADGAPAVAGAGPAGAPGDAR
ncbi:DUF4129 domain-containing protein [Kitasatospora sp. NBC_00458]|uniref:DUF4129 domain-containing protein n=1 Tax=Kitasatospora sp. NBC_00458 TaxID=2903568 RepID=UPI002E181D59